jgi:hypothetical protein
VPSFPGSLEYIFPSTGVPRGSYSIGAVAVDGFFLTTTLTRRYDLLIIFDQTTPSALSSNSVL